MTLHLVDWTALPGARYRADGPYSGQAYREEVLVPAFRKYTVTGRPVTINLDGTEGIAASFLEEAFGGLVREKGIAALEGIVVEGLDSDYAEEARSFMIEAASWRSLEQVPKMAHG